MSGEADLPADAGDNAAAEGGNATMASVYDRLASFVVGEDDILDGPVSKLLFSFEHYFFPNCMFYQLVCVQHSCSSTQSWGNVLPSIVETRD